MPGCSQDAVVRIGHSAVVCQLGVVNDGAGNSLRTVRLSFLTERGIVNLLSGLSALA